MIEIVVNLATLIFALWLLSLSISDVTRFGKYIKRYYIERVDEWNVIKEEYIPKRYFLIEKNFLLPFYKYKVGYEPCDKDGKCSDLEDLIRKKNELSSTKKKEKRIKMSEKDLVFEEI